MRTKVLVCKEMGWTFDEYDAVPARELAFMLSMWEGEHQARERSRRTGGKSDAPGVKAMRQLAAHYDGEDGVE